MSPGSVDDGLDRRSFLGYAGIGAGALLLGGVPVDPAMALRRRRRGGVSLAAGGRFSLGVAAGQPAPTSIRLWTRLHGVDRDHELVLEVARDKDFRRVVERRRVIAAADRDFTAERRVAGLRPGHEYYYRFATKSGSSPVGRFRTLRPPDSREPVRVALFGCQAWDAGYYGAHAAIAAEDVDFVLCQGDYTYEHSLYTGPREDKTGPNKDGDCQTLPEYREKYRLYKSDKDLQAMHAAHAIQAIWDDHDVQNDYARDQSGSLAFPPRLPFPERRRAAYRAFYEYLPIAPVVRDARRGVDLYRRERIGGNVELFLLDGRQYRDPQPCRNTPLVPCAEAETGARTLLGKTQLAWLKQGLADSSATWKLIGNPVMMMALEIAPSTPFYKDSWDGYGVERRELLGHVKARGIENVSIITGDYHNFFAGDVGENGRGPGSVATEFLVGSVTSHGDEKAVADALGVPVPGPVATIPLRLVVQGNPHFKYVDPLSRGYGLLEARRDELLVTYKAVRADVRSTESRVIGRFRVADGVPRVQAL